MAHPLYGLLLCSEEYGEQAATQPNEQRDGRVKQCRYAGSAPARVHLWCVSPRLAGVPLYQRRALEEPNIGTYAVQAITVRAWTTGFQEPAGRHPLAGDRRGKGTRVPALGLQSATQGPAHSERR